MAALFTELRYLFGGMGFMVHIMNIMPGMHEESLTVLFHIIDYLIYGLVVSYVIARYGQFEEKI